MTVLITGGAGYIGSHTVRSFRAAGHDVVVLDSLELGRADAVIDAPLIVGNISDGDLVERVCREHAVDAIVHFAAYKSVDESMRLPGRYWHNNVDGTVRLLEAAMATGVERVVFSSSCSVYGNPPEVPVGEHAPIAPESVYAETKATVERMLRWYGSTHGLRSVSLRYFNAAGASLDGRVGEDWSFSTNLIPVAMKALLGAAPPLRIFGADYPTADGTCVRDYVHVEDLADAHVAALGYLTAGGDTAALNVGTGVGSSVRDVLAATERVAGREVPHEFVDRRLGDPAATFADPTTAATVLGWRARHDLDTIVDTAFRWHAAHVTD